MSKYSNVSTIELLKFTKGLTVDANVVIQHVFYLSGCAMRKVCYTGRFIQYTPRLMSIEGKWQVTTAVMEWCLPISNT